MLQILLELCGNKSKMKEKILIMLPTGKTGYLTTVELLREGYPVKIYARSRNRKAMELEKLGAEVAIGALNSLPQLLNALKDVRKVYYNHPIMPGMAENVEIFIHAAEISKIEAIVFMGQRIAEFDDTGSALTNSVRQSYALFEGSGLNVVYFVPGYFAENAFVTIEWVLQLGMMPNPFGKGKNPWISNGDMGRSIAALLKNPAPYFGKKLFPTGPRSISPVEMAEIFAKESGRKIRVVPTPDWLFLKGGMMGRKKLGYDTYTIVQASIYNRQMQLNRFDIEPTDVVKHLTARDPEDFETITKSYFSNSPYRKRTIFAWLSAMIKFMIMPFTPIPNAKKIAGINR